MGYTEGDNGYLVHLLNTRKVVSIRDVIKKQVDGLDYFEAFAPTCKPETFRILFQLSAKQGYMVHESDVKTAFLR